MDKTEKQARDITDALTSSEWKRGWRDGRNCTPRDQKGNAEYLRGYAMGLDCHYAFDD